MEKKICSKCKIEKELCDFGMNNTYKSGVSNRCKQCESERGKKYRIKNKEKKQSYLKEYHIKNKKKINSRSKEYNIKNKEKIKEYRIKNKEKELSRVKEYKIKNKEKIKSLNKEYNIKNRERRNEYKRNKRLNDPIFKLTDNIRNRLNKYLKTTGITKNKKTFDIVGCSPPVLKDYLERQFVDGMRWEKIGKEIHIDHIIPLSSAKTKEEIYKLCHYTNLQPLWAEDNLAKSNKLDYLYEIDKPKI